MSREIELEEKLDMALSQVELLENQLNEARAEVEQLKQALHDARLENSGQAALIEELKEKVDQLQYIADFDRKHLLKRQEVKVTFVGQPSSSGGSGGSFAGNDHIPDATKMIRPEPSRLEIAAMFMARPEWGYTAGQALKVADLLIEAAKGGAE